MIDLNKSYLDKKIKIPMDKIAYQRKLWYIIPAVSLIISIIYMAGYKGTTMYEQISGILSNLVLTGGIWLGCATIVNILWKKFPWEIHPIKHLIIEFFSTLIYANLFTWLYMWFTLTYVYPELEFTKPEIIQSIISINFITFLITSIHEAIYFYKQWKDHFSKSAKLEKDNIQAKYETLKSQINPHFLFNSLNSLTNIVDDNPKAVDYIDSLSEFLRYVLKSRDRELVLVRDEVKMLKKYLNLQKSRFGENLQIDLLVDEKHFHYSLPPLVLQMLVENCVKHNVISKKHPLSIKIKSQKHSIFVENNLQVKESISSTGQGLRNIKDRYAYFTTNEVKMVKTNLTYKVEIPLLLIEL